MKSAETLGQLLDPSKSRQGLSACFKAGAGVFFYDGDNKLFVKKSTPVHRTGIHISMSLDGTVFSVQVHNLSKIEPLSRRLKLDELLWIHRIHLVPGNVTCRGYGSGGFVTELGCLPRRSHAWHLSRERLIHDEAAGTVSAVKSAFELPVQSKPGKGTVPVRCTKSFDYEVQLGGALRGRKKWVELNLPA